MWGVVNGVVNGVTMSMLKRYVTSVLFPVFLPSCQDPEGRGSTKTLGKQWFRLSGRRFVNPGLGGAGGAVKSWLQQMYANVQIRDSETA